MTLFREWTVGPKGARKAGAVSDSLPFVAHTCHALSLYRPPWACRPRKRFSEQFLGRFRGFGNYLFYPFRSFHAHLLCCAALLAGCTTAPTVPEVVRVPVPISCIQGEPPAKPETASEAEILAMDEFAATISVWTERLMLKSYALRAEAVILGCR